MNNLERFFKEQDKIIADDKAKTLIALGLVEKEYSPDGKSNYLYSKIDFVNGEKCYYREIPLKLTDEEYAEVLRKKALVDAIKEKEEQERNRKYASQHANRSKKLVPIFSKPKSEWEDPDKKEDPKTGKSKNATALRIIAYISLLLSLIATIVLFATNNFILACALMASVAVENALFFSFAEILDNIAEQTAILRDGYIYKETNK